MQHHRPALNWHRRFADRRGVVLLLAVYFASLMLLILSGITIQRTMLETRVGQLSRDTSQGFYLAEGAFDSTLARVKTETLADRTPSTIPTFPGQAAYALETVSADLSVGHQKLVRRIIATGQSGNSGTQQVSGYLVEEGPLAGVYGKKVTVAHSSLETEDVSAIQAFLLASMSSQRGAIASTKSKSTLNLDGVGHGDPAQSPAANELALQDSVSEELRSLKSGYMYMKQLSAVDSTSMKYDKGFLQDQIPHATGAVSSGVKITAPTAPLPWQFSFLAKWGYCSSDIVVPPGGLVINDATELSASPGTTLEDIDKDPGKIVICVNSIHPEGDEAWLDAVLDEPPALVFKAPVTIYVTGSKMFNVRGYHVATPLGSLLTDDAFPLVGMLTGAGPIQLDWRVSVGAKISAVDAFGKTIPNGVNIIMTQPLVAPGVSSAVKVESNPPGLIWLKPGKFSGSVYAPDSLVLVRERDVADRELDQAATDAAEARYQALKSKNNGLDYDPLAQATRISQLAAFEVFGCALPGMATQCQALRNQIDDFNNSPLTEAEKIELASLGLNDRTLYKPLELQSLVGNEVVMEMGTDRVQVGKLVDPSQGGKTVTIQGWTTGP